MGRLKKQDVILMTVGLIGAVLLWIDVDPGGWLLYLSFLCFGGLRVSDFFGLNPYERTKPQVLKFLFAMMMIIMVITHVIWGGEPLFGLLATLLLLYGIASLDADEREVSDPEMGE